MARTHLYDTGNINLGEHAEFKELSHEITEVEFSLGLVYSVSKLAILHHSSDDGGVGKSTTSTIARPSRQL